jgi:hypothetical protein
MNDEALWRELRGLATPAVDPRFAAEVRRRAAALVGEERRPTPGGRLWRVTAAACLAAGVIACFCWSVCFVLAPHL